MHRTNWQIQTVFVIHLYWCSRICKSEYTATQGYVRQPMKKEKDCILVVLFSQHYICWSELPVPRIAVTFSLQEVEEIEKDCAVYRGRMERIAKHSAISREEQVIKLTQV